MIKIKDVTKIYGQKRVLNSINLHLPRQQTHVILGSSGCGKTTLFRIMMGLIPATSGEVEINGEVMNRAHQKTLVRKMGYVVQDSGLFPHLTAEQNVSLLMKTLGEPRAKIKKRVLELSELVKFEPSVLGKYPKELSGGQKQRVGLIRALMLDPEVLLFDEPLGALDPIVRSELQEELKRIFNQLKKTVLMITHDLGEAAYFGHTISLMDQGNLVQHGTFSDLARKPKTPFVTQFLHAQKPPKELLEVL